MNTKVLFLVFILIVILIVIVTIRSSSSQKQPDSESQIPQSEVQQMSRPLNVQSNFDNETLDVTESFTITFSQPVDGSTVFFDIEPEVAVSASFNSTNTTLTLEPIQAWGFDTLYTVTLSKQTTAVDGSKIDKDQVFKFQTIKYSGI